MYRRIQAFCATKDTMCSVSLHRMNRIHVALDCIMIASDWNSFLPFVNSFIQFQLLMDIGQLSNFKTFSVKLVKFMYCKLGGFFFHCLSLGFRSVFPNLHIVACLRPKFCHVWRGTQSLHTLCSVALFLRVYLLHFPYQSYSIRTLYSPTLARGWKNPGCQSSGQLRSWHWHVEFVGPRRGNCFV